jgi:hypothetical protein
MSKKLLAIIAVLVLLVVFFVSLSSRGSKSPDGPGSIVTIDEDTGDTVITDKNRTPEKLTAGLVSIYGGDKIYNLMSNTQYSLLREHITFFVQSKVGPSISVVKVLPDTISFTDSSVDFTLKTVEPEKLILVRTVLYKSRSVKISYYDASSQALLLETGYLNNDPIDSSYQN